MKGGHTQPDVPTAQRRIIRLAQTDSTNRYLKEHCVDLPDGTVCYTDCQQEGRGRLGRCWVVPPHTSLALSVLVSPDGPVRLLPLICGVAAAQAIERMAGLPAYIKWPNDIVCNNRKVCGILCEGGVKDGRRYAVAGIGINLSQVPEDMQRAGLEHAASLAMLTGQKIVVEDMARELIAAFDRVWDDTVRAGSDGMLRVYRKACLTLGRPVKVLAAESWQGTAVDIDEEGNLLVEADGKCRAVCAGEVSVRGLYGYV